MKPRLFEEFVVALLVLLFLYSGISKLMDLRGFRSGMLIQPFPRWVSLLLAYLLPPFEVLVAAGLVFSKTRIFSLYAYLTLMGGFTLYTLLIVSGFFKHRPCGCGGIISGMSWEGHLAFNLLFLALGCYALYLGRRHNVFMHKQGVSRKPENE